MFYASCRGFDRHPPNTPAFLTILHRLSSSVLFAAAGLPDERTPLLADFFVSARALTPAIASQRHPPDVVGPPLQARLIPPTLQPPIILRDLISLESADFAGDRRRFG